MSYRSFPYVPGEDEAEKASNSYLMSVITIIFGLPVPFVNLITTLIFFFSNRKDAYFVRWHCTQALLSQMFLVLINGVAFTWSLLVLFTEVTATNYYVAFILMAVLMNIIEFVATVAAAIQTRKGKHVVWWFCGNLTNLICKPDGQERNF